ncbi:MAG: hypothetical protein JWP47_2539 [Polaromonas sp.]|nr:hypothetical protein [Polaromonas sp.]
MTDPRNVATTKKCNRKKRNTTKKSHRAQNMCPSPAKSPRGALTKTRSRMKLRTLRPHQVADQPMAAKIC